MLKLGPVNLFFSKGFGVAVFIGAGVLVGEGVGLGIAVGGGSDFISLTCLLLTLAFKTFVGLGEGRVFDIGVIDGVAVVVIIGSGVLVTGVGGGVLVGLAIVGIVSDSFSFGVMVSFLTRFAVPVGSTADGSVLLVGPSEQLRMKITDMKTISFFMYINHTVDL